MSSQPVSHTGSRKSQATKPTTDCVYNKRSSAYDANFQQHCIDCNIYPPFYKFADGFRPSKPANLDEIRQALEIPRDSLSPSKPSELAFEDFQQKNTTESEGTVMRNVIPLLAGDSDIPNEGHLLFNNLDSLTEDATVNPNPDFFDGADFEAVDREVRKDLEKVIIPTRKVGVPVAPNFFLEVKSPTGNLYEAKRQVVLDGAHGAAIMLSLQNYLLDRPVYDGNAYTFTATFLDGFLTLYAHHPSAPARPGQRPGYQVTQLNAYALTGNHESWLAGIGAFRNLRKLAKGYRDQFIDIANTRARDRRSFNCADDEGSDPATALEEAQDGGSRSLDFHDFRRFTEPEDDELATENNYEETLETEDAKVGLDILHEGHAKDATDSTAASPGCAASSTSFTWVSREVLSG